MNFLQMKQLGSEVAFVPRELLYLELCSIRHQSHFQASSTMCACKPTRKRVFREETVSVRDLRS